MGGRGERERNHYPNHAVMTAGFRTIVSEYQKILLYEQYFRYDVCECVEVLLKVPMTGRWGRNEPMDS
jgi:hypothetical protein